MRLASYGISCASRAPKCSSCQSRRARPSRPRPRSLAPVRPHRQQKLGIRPNPAPFGTSLRRQSSTGPSLGPPARPYGRSSTPDPADPARPASPLLPGAGPFPGAVSLTRALLSEDGLPLPPDSPDRLPRGSNGDGDRAPLSSSTSSARLTAGNPFFGSAGSSRERISKSAASASSGSGKVISGLQSELLARSSALDTARQQLRVSQRAVEFLTRQNGARARSLAAPRTADLFRAAQRTSRRPRSASRSRVTV